MYKLWHKVTMYIFNNRNECIHFRSNIYLSFIMDHPQDFESTFQWYIEELKEKGRETRKAIIYCR